MLVLWLSREHCLYKVIEISSSPFKGRDNDLHLKVMEKSRGPQINYNSLVGLREDSSILFWVCFEMIY